MQGSNRRASVYDLTGLRLRPNGYRVHQTRGDSGLVGYRQHNTQHPRGWIADDAGGSIVAAKYRIGDRTPAETEDIKCQSLHEQGLDGSGEETNTSDEAITVNRKRTKRPNNPGPLKRKKFIEDDTYISALARGLKFLKDGSQLPSQDLLKNIHYLAAIYYDERGMLVNASKRYREAKRIQKLQRQAPTPNSTAAEDTNEDDIPEHIVVEADINEQQENINRDMYRVLDGSFLVAIGVLTQEMVKKLLHSRRQKLNRQTSDIPTTSDSGLKEDDYCSGDSVDSEDSSLASSDIDEDGDMIEHEETDDGAE